MNCPVCHKANPDQARICAFCATVLTNRCDRCGFENPLDFHFCGKCGFRIGESKTDGFPGPAQTTGDLNDRLRAWMPEAFAEKIAAERGREGRGRREVTVLFLDLQGFTTFSENHEPEAVFARLDHCRRAFVEVIYEYEGSVDKFTGDGLMALFGVPVAHENDPERACRAGLEMHRRLLDINEQWRDEGLQMRIGINTGQVIAGHIGPNLRMEYTVIGDTVNVAQRLETLAEPGTVLISESSYQRVAHLFNVEEIGMLQVKGRQETVGCYQISSLRAQASTQSPAQAARPFVGRQSNLMALDDIAEQTRQGQGQVVLITGEAGIGKSRLLDKWQAQLNPHIYRTVYGASLSYRQPVSYWPFITILETLFAIQETDSKGARWDKMRRFLEERVPEIAPDELLPFLAHFMSLPIPDPQLAQQVQRQAPAQLRQQDFIALRVLLASLAFQQPLFVILEEMHLADSATLDLLVFLLGKTENIPLTFILVARTENTPVFDRLDRLVGRVEERLTRMELPSLTWLEMGLLLDQLLLGKRQRPETFSPARRDHLLRQAAGNPFFMEELLATWAATGNLVPRSSPRAQRSALDQGDARVPATLTALITARLDRLSADAHRTLQLASVIGRTFPLNLLQHVAQHDAYPLTPAPILAELAEQDVVERVEAAEAPLRDAGEQQWRFQHPLVRETIYAELLLRERRELHALVAGSMEILFSPATETSAPLAELIAHHYEQAQEWQRALPFLIQGAASASARFDNGAVIHYGTRALALTDKIEVSLDDQWRLHDLLGDASMFDQLFDEAELHYRQAAELAAQPALWEARRSAEAHRKVARLNERRGEYEAALHWLSEALQQLERDEQDTWEIERARILNDLGWVSYKLGDLERAQSLAFRSLALLEGSDAMQDIASAYNRLVATYSVQGKWSEAHAFALKSLKLRYRLGFQPGIASSCGTMATLLIRLDRWAEARRFAQQMLTIARAISARDLEGEALLLLASLDLLQGAHGEALAKGQQALALIEEWEMRPLRLAANHTLAQVQAARGELKAAHRFILRALEEAHLLAMRESEAEVHSDYADILRARGALPEAQREAQLALEMAQEVGSPLVEASAHRALGCCAMAQAEWLNAEMHFRHAGELFVGAQLRYELARVEFYMATLRGRQGNLAEAHTLLKRAVHTFQEIGAAHDLREAAALAASWVPAQRATG